ncbi:hypothetical protein BGZ94_001639 [Podila epigama]|nr:hypothetical protein BGZ94_001639 [Podila epigama]
MDPPRRTRLFILFTAFVCLILDIVATTRRESIAESLGHSIGTFLPDILTLFMFFRFRRHGTDRYSRNVRIALLVILTIATIIWPIATLIHAALAFTSGGHLWRAYGLNLGDVFFCTEQFQTLAPMELVDFIHVVRARDFLAVFYLVLAGLELRWSLAQLEAILQRRKEHDILALEDHDDMNKDRYFDGEDIEIVLDQKADADINDKNEIV